MHRDGGTPRLGSKLGLRDEDLKHFVHEKQARMCDVIERSERQAYKCPEFQLQLHKRAVKENVKNVSIS